MTGLMRFSERNPDFSSTFAIVHFFPSNLNCCLNYLLNMYVALVWDSILCPLIHLLLCPQHTSKTMITLWYILIFPRANPPTVMLFPKFLGFMYGFLPPIDFLKISFIEV